MRSLTIDGKAGGWRTTMASESMYLLDATSHTKSISAGGACYIWASGRHAGLRTYCGECCMLHVRLVHGLLKTKAVFSIELCFPQHFIALIERI